MPNVNPPHGHKAMLQDFLKANPLAKHVTISTFDFGYPLESKLLLELTQIGGSEHGFIPDSGMVPTSKSRADSLSSRPAGASKSMLVTFSLARRGSSSPSSHSPMSTSPATLTYRPFNTTEYIKVQAEESLIQDMVSIRYQAARLDFVDALFSIPETPLPKPIQALETLRDRISATTMLENHKDAEAQVQDISGEGLFALRSRNFPCWGRHYLPCLARAQYWRLSSCRRF